MKKYIKLGLIVFALAGCGGYVKNQGGSENLVRLDVEPVGCKMLYKMQTTASYYEISDAYRYLENNIVERATGANAYWVEKQSTVQNDWTMFGPERSFVFDVRVYNCPNL